MVVSRQRTAREFFWDAVLGLAVWAAVSWMITADQASEQAPDAIAYFWAFGLGALMLMRRAYPLIVLWTTVITLFAYYLYGYPAVGLSIPTAVALLSAAEFRRLRWPVVAAAALLLVSYAVRLAQGQDFNRIIGYELAGELGLMAAAIALGVSLRLRRQLRDSTEKLVEATAHQERAQAAAEVATERADIARDLHDSLGHQVTVITMYADVAWETVDHDPSAARDALDVVGTTGAEMMSELRQTVKSLRGRQSSRELTTVRSLQEQVFNRLPLTVHADIDPEARTNSLPVPVQTAIYRIVQEALTNVLRHSAADAAHVTIRQDADTVDITVEDAGPAREAADSAGSGTGLPGMTERAAALGGWLTTESAGAGFAVRASLPVHREDPR